MALSIKNAEAERLARELARERGTTVTRAVIGALGRRTPAHARPESRAVDKGCDSRDLGPLRRAARPRHETGRRDSRIRRYPAHRRRTGSLNAALEVDIAGTSLNRISKCFCVFANPSVPCHDHDQHRWLVNHLRCSQMHGVERTNWLDRKRSTDTSENRVCDTDYVTPKLKTTERGHCRLLFVGRQPRRCTRSKNRPCGFGCGSSS